MELNLIRQNKFLLVIYNLNIPKKHYRKATERTLFNNILQAEEHLFESIKTTDSIDKSYNRILFFQGINKLHYTVCLFTYIRTDITICIFIGR